MSKKRVQSRPSHRPLSEVEAFIRLIHSNLSTAQGSPQGGIWFYRTDEGSLFLDPAETKTYRALVAQLIDKFVKGEDLSQRSVESYLQETVFSSLDLRSKTKDPFDDRLLAALSRLAQLLKAPPEKWHCWVPIEGLKLDTSRAQFAGVSFVRFGPSQIQRITLRRPRTPQARGKSWRHGVELVRKSELWNGVCAVVEVEARDPTAADALALRKVRRIVDAVNLFTDLVPYNHGWLYLPGDTAKSRMVVAVQKEDGGFFPRFTNRDPLADVSWKSLRAATHIAAPFGSLSRLARSTPAIGKCGSLLLTAAEWAGRATVERQREQSFLLFAISLETMMLPVKETQGLGHRLRLRVAHLLGRSIEARQRIAKDVSRLYAVRSKIVHAGSYEVTDADLGRLRQLVKSCLLRLLAIRKLHAMERDDYSEWLDRQLLR